MSARPVIIRCVLEVIIGPVFTNADLTKYAIDIGDNITIPCGEKLVPFSDDDDGNSPEFMWLHEGRHERQISRLAIQPNNGTLILTEVNRNDSGIYSCYINGPDGEYIRQKVHLFVRTPPPPLPNVTVAPSTILAVILWEVKEDGGYPIIDFTAEFRLAHSNDSWTPISPNHIPPNLRQIDVYRLEPNTTYAFRVWATNQLGSGEPVEVHAKTLHHMEEIELARHLLAGAENFDTRVWVAAVAIVMGTLVILTIGVCYLLYIESRSPVVSNDEQEIIELVPNIILNPGFDDDRMPLGIIRADENCNSETTLRLNNNTVIQPRRL
ncbi:protein sidekick-1 [Chrysoperla carnea]|uniref:protein sidekick-1 n=1 Tax=Chrysoperla carnea TaxID=189513 RepID=UPI001D087B34|nr:protein sidekick-1 [Chrysoperla carnea]